MHVYKSMRSSYLNNCITDNCLNLPPNNYSDPNTNVLYKSWYGDVVWNQQWACRKNNLSSIEFMAWINNHIHITSWDVITHPWASCKIHKIAGCACAGNAGNVSPRHRLQGKPLVSDPCMHHGTCVTHEPWCMSGSLTRGGWENVPGIPGACAPAILRILQEAHAIHVRSNAIEVKARVITSHSFLGWWNLFRCH